MTEWVRVPAPAKLNLFLHVLGRRPDGYHALESFFQLIDFNDYLSFSVRDDGQVSRINDVPGVAPEQDLCVRAARLLQSESGVSLGVDIRVEKHLPMGGGLGGGSSDAASTLLALNRLWRLGWSRNRLQQLALRLGADVPVFVFGQNAFAQGVGEQLSAIALPQAWYVVLVPDVQVSTVAIFSHPELTRDSKSINMLDFPDVVSFQHLLCQEQVLKTDETTDDASFTGLGRWLWRNTRNDLQAVVCQRHPQVEEAIKWLEQYAVARMTGSGACVFATFERENEARYVLSQLPGYMYGVVAQGLAQHPLRDWVGDG